MKIRATDFKKIPTETAQDLATDAPEAGGMDKPNFQPRQSKAACQKKG